MPNSTRISSAIRMIAWPSCKFRLRAGLVRVLSTVDRICSDDDVVANCLLYQWSDWLERVPERDLDRLVAGRGGHVIAPGAHVRRWVGAQAAARPVGCAVAGGARVGDEDPSGVRGRFRGRALRDATVGQRAVGTGRVIGEVHDYGVAGDRVRDVGVGGPGMRGAVGIDEVRGPDRDA